MKCKLLVITCMLFTPLILVAVPLPVVNVATPYALNYTGGNTSIADQLFGGLTYFSFYTFFQKGIDPDCIDMTEELEKK